MTIGPNSTQKSAADACGARVATVDQACLLLASSSAILLAASSSSALHNKKKQREQRSRHWQLKLDHTRNSGSNQRHPEAKQPGHQYNILALGSDESVMPHTQRRDISSSSRSYCGGNKPIGLARRQSRPQGLTPRKNKQQTHAALASQRSSRLAFFSPPPPPSSGPPPPPLAPCATRGRSGYSDRLILVLLAIAHACAILVYAGTRACMHAHGRERLRAMWA